MNYRSVIKQIVAIALLVSGGLFLDALYPRFQPEIITQKDYTRSDIWAYHTFAQRYEDYSHDIQKQELYAILNELKIRAEKRGKTFFFDYRNKHIPQRTIRDIIVKGLNIEFLVDALRQQSMTVTTISEIDCGAYTERVVSIDDRSVGSFEVMVLIPKSMKASYPAVIGLHGHGDGGCALDFKKRYLGETLVQNGFVVVLPNFRAMGADIEETAIAEKLLLHGFTLLGLRVYETLSVVNYVKWLPYVNDNAIGILSHSGGSAVSNIVVQLSDDIRAHVFDYKSTYFNFLSHQQLHCETVPALYEFNRLINDVRPAYCTELNVPYDFQDQQIQQNIVEFFKQELTENTV